MIKTAWELKMVEFGNREEKDVMQCTFVLKSISVKRSLPAVQSVTISVTNVSLQSEEAVRDPSPRWTQVHHMCQEVIDRLRGS